MQKKPYTWINATVIGGAYRLLSSRCLACAILNVPNMVSIVPIISNDPSGIALAFLNCQPKTGAIRGSRLVNTL